MTTQEYLDEINKRKEGITMEEKISNIEGRYNGQKAQRELNEILN